MTRSRVTCCVCLLSLAGVPAGIAAGPKIVVPPNLQLSIGGTRMSVGAPSFLWKGHIVDSAGVSEMRDPPLLRVCTGKTALLQMPKGAQEVTISEVVERRLTGHVVIGTRDRRAIRWTPVLRHGTASVEVFVNTKPGFVGYAFTLSRP